MGRILIRFGDEVARLPLTASTLVGRSSTCHARVEDPRVPAVWLELRWRRASWWWRALAAPEVTRGPGAVDAHGWRPIAEQGGRGQAITLEGVGHLELVDASPPSLLLQDLTTGAWVEDADAEQLLAEAAATPASDVVETPGQLWRVYRSTELPDTASQSLALHEATLDVDPEALRATFTFPEREVTVEGEAVRILWVFAEVRVAGSEDGGWMSAAETFAAWQEAGGNPGSSQSRMSWERGKLRTELRRQGVQGASGLFVKKGSGPRTLVRLDLLPERIHIWTRDA